MRERRRIQVQGIVQGVGFRPFVYGLATRAGLVGYVLNDAAGVTIEVEGEPAALNAFITALSREAPPLALVERVVVEDMPPADSSGKGFAILESRPATSHSAFVSPDVATCPDCLRELFDPADRRYRYPFINCTNCGPRFTIIQDVPYDRPLTTMAPFLMCQECQREYEDPADRRFHAQPNACPVCGPILDFGFWILEPALNPKSKIQNHQDLIVQAQVALAEGYILAIKGLGGYHLACDASNQAAVHRLRARKVRWDKPFALMAADLATVEAICHVGEEERRWLTDRRRPIVLLRRREEARVAPEVAPGQKTLGVMLPYTPLHHLLFTSHQGSAAVPLLVMTSGNLSDEPIAYEDEEARERLTGVADFCLGHNRAIHVRCDDSVMRVVGRRPIVIRRSRGYAPQPLLLNFDLPRPTLAVGGYLKNTFGLGKGRYAFLSHHVGDLDNLETLLSFQDGIEHFQRLFDVRPEVVAHDLHPDYASTQYAQRLPGVEMVAVQHHHAHVASVLAEHGLAGPVIGVAFDGAGYGPDGTVWGGEFLVADLGHYERVAHLAEFPLPGGDKAVQEPWRVAAGWLYQLYGEEWLEWPLPFSQQTDQRDWGILRQMIERRVNTPLTSSMGRLFDAVAALVGVRRTVNYEGQAAVELEALADEGVIEGYHFRQDGLALSPIPLLGELLADLHAGKPPAVMAARFHNAIAELVLTVCQQLRQERGLKQVALSGGVFQNALLLGRTLAGLDGHGFEVYTNERVPANDGGISLGQLAVAAHQNFGDGRRLIQIVG